MKILKIVLIILILLFILIPKPYDVVGGIAGHRPGPWKCLGYTIDFGLSRDPEKIIPDSSWTGYCIGIPWLSK